MQVNSNKLYQVFKYTIYALLAFNIYVFFAEEHLAAKLQFPGGVGFSDMIEAYAATIDTSAWVVLLLMFELETYVLEDHQYHSYVSWTLHTVRILCYTFIVYAFYGYVVNLNFINMATAYAGINNVCSLVADAWSYAVDLDEYTQITAANCHSFTSATSLFQLHEMPAVVDAKGLADIRNLAWVDVINSAVWLLVVLVLEIDVRLQEKNQLEGLVLRVSSLSKFVMYSILLLAAIFWGIKGDFVDFWDAFLWLVAFVFIEMNVFEWRQEEKDNQTKTDIPALTG